MAHRSDLIANQNWAPRAIATTPVSNWLVTAARELLDAVFFWYERDRERRALTALDGRMLRDIGLTRADIQVEVEKRVWER